MIALHVAAAGVSLWPQPSKVVINDPTLVTFTGNFAFVSSGESSEELQNAIHRYCARRRSTTAGRTRAR